MLSRLAKVKSGNICLLQKIWRREAPDGRGWWASLRELKDADGRYLEKVLMEQKEILKRYALTEQDEKN